MKRKKLFLIIGLLIFAFFFAGCSRLTYESIYPSLADGKYDSEFPYKSSSDDLTKISETIQRINTTAFYKIYIFDSKSKYQLKDLANKQIDNIAVSEALANNSTAGTALTVFSANGYVALLSCAHTVTFPDTIVAYKLDENGSTSPFVESISIKEKQVIYVAGFPEGSQVDVIVKNDKSDIAILGRKYGSLSNVHFPTFKFPLGKAKEIEWGTFVYLFGYPINYKMITKAIVSSPKRDESGSFLVDAVVNPGFSGGPVLAIRDGVPNFELVGMVQWVPQEDENLIYPEDLKNKSSYNPVVPYTGNLFVRKHSSISYGIAKIIPVESIMAFIQQNKDYLNKKGYFIFEQH